ncbi:MAG: flagellar hook-basal body complex protein [Hyphomicrobiales bacterium]|nr:flagellar hook-basal body complex protein [Hyphomicrobiales bacterium]MCP5373626.1 flagellar hook-basal body complex protein [Hyphomicrobiales bacterium]
MSVIGWFTPSVTGMSAQAHAFSTISTNVANVNTGGYKATETRFATLVSDQIIRDRDFGGVQTQDHARIGVQGLLLASDRKLDVGINGQGFFVLNTQLDGSGETLLTRDGSFQVATGPDTTAIADDGSTITVQEGYLVDKNGYYVQGYTPNADGTFTASSTTTSLRIDNYAFAFAGEATTTATLNLNLPSDAAAGDLETYAVSLVDSDGVLQTGLLNFTKTANPGEWDVTVTTSNAGDTVNAAAGTLTFDSFGELAAGSPLTVDVTWAGGATTVASIDMTDSTQFGDSFSPFNYVRDGYVAADMISVEFDTMGRIIGNFGNVFTRPVYQLALATVVNPDSLTERNGNVYVAGPDSGDIQFTTAADEGFATFEPSTREISNVDIATEFTRMIIAQTAYNASATTFRTVDEMVQVARDLKR